MLPVSPEYSTDCRAQLLRVVRVQCAVRAVRAPCGVCCLRAGYARVCGSVSVRPYLPRARRAPPHPSRHPPARAAQPAPPRSSPPAIIRVTSESRPSHRRFTSRALPSHVRVTSKSHPSHVRVTSKLNLSQIRVTSESLPSQVRVHAIHTRELARWRLAGRGPLDPSQSRVRARTTLHPPCKRRRRLAGLMMRVEVCGEC
jgi:hypothetical protein